MDSASTHADTAAHAEGSKNKSRSKGGSAKQRTGVRGEYTASNKVLWLYGASEEPTADGSLEPPPPAERPAPVLCVPFVPGYMTATDFLSFTGVHRRDISHMLAVRHAHAPSSCLVALRFASTQGAADFRRAFDGRTFSPLEPETCAVGEVQGARAPGGRAGEVGGALAVFRVDKGETCAVCLEPLDGPLLTIMCRHTFHARCLGRWGDGACPVCRGRQAGAFVDHEAAAARALGGLAAHAAGDSQCQQCGRTDDLWICLVCGSVGCGRYAAGHAKDHFGQSAHPYAMKIDSQAVWDYAGDGYVHRVLQAAEDGKLVALEQAGDAPEKHGDDEEAGQAAALLAAQLASLRDHHAAEMQAQARELRAQAARHAEALAAEHARGLAAEQAEHRRVVEEMRAGWAAERARLEAQCARARGLAEEGQRRLDEERAISKALLERQDEAEVREKAMMARVDELTEHVRDLTFFISTQEALAKPGADELQGASIVAPPPPPQQQQQQQRKPRTSGKRRIPR
ncbi:hypothetical protein LPJ53_001047 [Coemansia erecta]|uniref:Zf-UBP-domain-containing protein n=1 Tax=Coemansia erecta TaxID=147472 RepID=A0A9W7Y478_9FUNG|nr:hypothetical protein LPJ53_001047 [Coemansia erecta]